MIDFSKKDSPLSGLLRTVLNVLSDDLVVRVLQGRVKGYRWIKGSGPNGFWLGSYETEKQRQLIEKLHSDDVFYDIGANVGYYSLLASEFLGRKGRVISFEPLPANLTFLRRHVELNRRVNISVYPLAVSENSAPMRFAATHSRFTSRIASDGELEVQGVSLDQFIFVQGNPLPNVMKIDVEGGEVGVLRGAAQLLSEHPPIIFLATHGEVIHKLCSDLLIEFGYTLKSLDERCLNETDELICFPPTINDSP